MDKEIIGLIIFKDGHTENIVGFNEIERDKLVEVYTEYGEKYVYKKIYEPNLESGFIIPIHLFYKRRFDKYEKHDYIRCFDIEKFEIYNT